MARAEFIVKKPEELVIQGGIRDLGELQFNVLQAVSEKHYDEGVRLLNEYQRSQPAKGPYAKRTGSIYKHAEDLIKAIQSKKNTPNLSLLPQNKQEEIHQRVLENWEDLKICLRRLRTIEKDMADEDARSSIWVIKAVIFSFVVILVVFVINEGFRSFGGNFVNFMKDTFQVGIDSLSSIF